MATMMEIAQLAGVSRGMVDWVINGRGGVNPETTERILRAATRLDYSVSVSEQSDVVLLQQNPVKEKRQ